MVRRLNAIPPANQPESHKKVAMLAGLSGRNEQSLTDPINAGSTLSEPLTQEWVNEELLRETMVVWSGIYGREVGNSEACEILANTKQLAEVLIQASESSTR